MKKIMIKTIKLYQKIPGSWHNNCRFEPTCSHYGIEAIETYGSIKGGVMTVGRILRCNPWSKGGYDPVVRRKDEKNN